MTRESLAKDAAFDGAAAFRACRPLSANPETPGTREYSAWTEAWKCELEFYTDLIEIALAAE